MRNALNIFSYCCLFIVSLVSAEENLGKNLILNGDLENYGVKEAHFKSKPIHWYPLASNDEKGQLKWDTDHSVSAPHSLKIEDINRDAYFGWESEVTMLGTENKLFKFRFKYKAEAINGTFRIEIRWFSEKNNANESSSKQKFIASYQKLFTDPSDTFEFQDFEQVIEAPAGSVYFQIQVISGGAEKDIGNFWIDDISLESVSQEGK